MLSKFERFLTKLFIIPATLYKEESFIQWCKKFIKRDFFSRRFCYIDESMLNIQGLCRYIISYPYAIGLLARQYNNFSKGKNYAKDLIFSKIKLENVSNYPICTKSVTVIVPCYNHARFLKKRLDTIYNQTYQNFNVLLLDDCSTDESRKILTEYKNKFPSKTTLVFNDENTGGPYRQWRKGLSLAKGDLVWIAESDDYCDNNFLQEHVAKFNDDAVMLSFSFSNFVKDDNIIDSSAKNLADCIKQECWDVPFITTAHDFVNRFLGKKNVIINVSSCVIRNIDFSIFDTTRWFEYRLCGDWIFYLHIIAGGLVSYTNIAKNYYRIHEKSTSISVQRQLDYYKEHEDVGINIAQLYKINMSTLFIHYDILKKRFHQQHGSELNFNDYYNFERVREAVRKRKPNILMCCYALISGGGETFPISLANGLKHRGFVVTLLDFNGALEDPAIRNRILPNVPLVHRRGDVGEIISGYAIDIVHSHHAVVDETFSDERMKNPNFRLVVTQHGMYEMMNEFSERIYTRIFGVDEWVYIAEKNIIPFINAKYFSKNNFTKISNAVEKKKFQKLERKDYGIPEDAFVFCIASRGIPEKGWREAIQAVSIARELSCRDIHLILVGNGELYDELKNISPEFIHFTGFQSNILGFFSMSDMGLVASTFKGESVPLVILECYMVGNPVLSTNLGEIPFMLEMDSLRAGELIDLNDDGTLSVDALAKSMVHIVMDSNYYNTLKSNVPFVAQKFDYDKMLDQYIGVYYRSLLNIWNCQ